MSQIQSYGGPNNACLGFKPGNTCSKPMNFKANKCPDSQTNMVSLRDFKPVLATFNAGELFEAAMINLNLPGIQGMKSGFHNGHFQAAGCPVFRVAFFVDCPKNFDPVRSVGSLEPTAFRHPPGSLCRQFVTSLRYDPPPLRRQNDPLGAKER